jgi:hypothetical protein
MGFDAGGKAGISFTKGGEAFAITQSDTVPTTDSLPARRWFIRMTRVRIYRQCRRHHASRCRFREATGRSFQRRRGWPQPGLPGWRPLLPELPLSKFGNSGLVQEDFNDTQYLALCFGLYGLTGVTPDTRPPERGIRRRILLRIPTSA